MRYTIWLLLSIVWVSTDGWASHALVSGGLDSTINIDVITDNQLKQLVPDIRLQSTPLNGARVARIYCDNNNFHGFSLTFSSDRLGRLVFYKNDAYPSSEKDGHVVPYSLDLIRGETGSLGLDMPPDVERIGFSLHQPVHIFFNDQVQEATHQAELYLNMHVEKKPSLFHGTFQDTITVTITDL